LVNEGTVSQLIYVTGVRDLDTCASFVKACCFIERLLEELSDSESILCCFSLNKHFKYQVYYIYMQDKDNVLEPAKVTDVY